MATSPALRPLIFAGLTIPPAKAINAAAKQREITTAADLALVPVTYGEDRVPALILNVLISAADPRIMLVQCLWGHAVDDIDDVLWNGEALPAGASVTHYLGDQTTPDADLVDAFDAQSITYTDTLAGYAYSVVALPVVDFTGQLELSAWLHGRRVYDPRLDSTAGGSGAHRLATPSTWEWSDCPALCLADWIASPEYGAGQSVLWSSVPDAADANDALVGSPAERRRIIGLTISSSAEAPDLADALRAYAGCWLVPTVDGIRLLPDQDASPVATYSHSSGDIASIAPLQLPDRAAAPTIMQVVYTDLSTGARRDGVAEAAQAGVGTTKPYRYSRVRLPGISRYSQALREAIERLNKLGLEGVATTLEVFDVGLRHERGDLIEVSHPIGLVAETMRVVQVDMQSPGKWLLELMRHDPLSYSDSVVTPGAFVDPSRIITQGPASDVTGAGASVAAGVVRIYWEPCPDLVYDSTEIRLADGDWGSYTVLPLYRGKASELPYVVSVADTYDFHIRHITAGNPSANTVTVSIVVGPGDLAGGGALPSFVVFPSTIVLPMTAAGTVSSFANASAVGTIVDPAGNDITDEYTYSIDSISGVTAVLQGVNGNELQVTGLSSSISAEYGNTIIQIHGDGSYADTSKYARQPKAFNGFESFGSASPVIGANYIKCNATSDWITVSGVEGCIRYGANANQTSGQDYSLVDFSGQPWIIECWVRVPSTITSGRSLAVCGSTFRNIFLVDAGAGQCQAVTYTSGKNLGTTSINSSNAAITLNASSAPHRINYGSWAHIRVSYCSDNVIRLYVNGVIAASQSLGAGFREDLHDQGPYSSSFIIGGTFSVPGYGRSSDEFHVCEIRSMAGISGPLANFTPPSVPFADTPIAVNPSVKIKAVKSGAADLYATVAFRTNIAPASVISTMTPAGVSIQADYLGNTSISNPAPVSALSVTVDGANDTQNWSIVGVRDQNSGMTGHIYDSNKTVAIDGMVSHRSVGVFHVYSSRTGFPTNRMRIDLSKIIATQPQVSASIPPAMTVAADSAGTVPSGNLPVTAQVVAVQSGSSVVSSYTWSTSVTTGLTASVSSGGLVSLTAMTQSVDAGTITLTGTRAGFPNITLYISVLKTKLLLPSGAVVNPMPAKTVYTDSSGTAYARIRYNTDGTIETWDELTASWIAAGNWYNPTTPGIGNTHYIRMTSTNIIEATSLTGARDTWLLMDVSRPWAAETPGGGTYSQMSATALISATAGGAILGQGPVTLIAQSL